MSFRDIALPLAERGFHVFPLIPKQKAPIALEGDGDHFDAATTDPAQIELWDKQAPRANVGIAPDEIFCFLETDDEGALKAACADLPPEVWNTARVGARENRCYYIYRQTSRTRRAGNMTATREGQDNLFEFKQHRAYVTGPSSVHPKTGGPYVAEWRNIPAMPDVLLNRLCEIYGAPKVTSTGAMNNETKRQTELLERFLATYEVAVIGDWFAKGKQWYLPIECPWASEHENDNAGTSTCIVYIEGGGYGFDCKHRCAGKVWKDFRAELERRFPERRFSFVADGGAEPELIIGGKSTVPDSASAQDWREHYHTFDDMQNAPPAAFLIDGFLQLDGITGLAAPVGQRKSLVALNVAYALCTGEPLFGHFAVSKKPDRVLYLCPEMGIRSFTDRLRKIGLMPHVAKTLFVRTMSASGTLELSALTSEELNGAVVILDTCIRYLKGDENSSEDMRVFAGDIFRLMRERAAAVLLLHHSSKGTKESGELSLENAMRGSGELGAFLDSCWATRLQDPNAPYQSASYLVNVKQRDYQSNPFEVKSGPDCRLHYVEQQNGAVPVLAHRRGNRENKDGLDAAADALLKENLTTPVRKIQEILAERGIGRGTTWISKRRSKLKGTGVSLTEC